MASVNKVLLLGNLGRDPELKYTQSGAAICTLTVATNEKYTDKNTGQVKENVEWHRVVVWNKTAENCAKYLSKGRPIFVEGVLKTRSWEKEDGTKGYMTEILGKNVQFLGGDKNNGAPARVEVSNDDSYGYPEAGEDAPRTIGDLDDIPF